MQKQGLSFNIRDAYPNMGLVDTRTTVQPESYDKVAFDDTDAESRETVESETNEGVSKKAIYKVLFGGLLVLIALSLLS